MFITVKSGASEERLFNLNCQVDAILRDITNRCPYKVEQGTNINDLNRVILVTLDHILGSYLTSLTRQ